MVNAIVNPSTLTYRLADREDLALLLELRGECGWGEDKVKRYLGDPDRPFCLFLLDLDGDQKVVGMGGWYLEMEGDPETASRERKTVYLTSLFIRQAYQNLRLGTRALDLLEQAAKKEFNAEWVTLDTPRWHTERSVDDIWIERIGIDAKTPKWYAQKGYLPYKDPKPFFAHPTKDDPDYKLTAVFLKKHT